MPDTNPEDYEVRYIKLPENVYYDLSERAKSKREKRAIQNKQTDDATALIMKTFDDLEGEVSTSKLLTPPILFRWIDSQGKTVWSGETAISRVLHHFRRSLPTTVEDMMALSVDLKESIGSFDVDAFVAALIAAMNDVKVPLFLIFEGAGGTQMKFCLRFT